MSRLNTTVTPRVAGGFGKKAADEPAFRKIARVAGTYMMFQEKYYPESEGDPISILLRGAAQIAPRQLEKIITTTRLEYGLRHTPILLMAGAMAGSKEHRQVIGNLPARVLARPSDATDLVAAYRKFGSPKGTIPNQLKKLICRALTRYDEYQLKKYKKTRGLSVSLRDVFRLVHPKPGSKAQAELWGKLITGTLGPADTWEHLISNCADQTPRRVIWEDLMARGKLPALATIRNIRNMLQDGVPPETIARHIDGLRSLWVWPYQILTLYTLPDEELPGCIREALGAYLVRLAGAAAKLPGTTYVLLDVSGSMGWPPWPQESLFLRAIAVAWTIGISSDDFRLFYTAGNTIPAVPPGGPKNPGEFIRAAIDSREVIGCSGIYTSKAVRWLAKNYREPDRLIVVSDSQDCDRRPLPVPRYGKRLMITNNIAAYNNVGYAANPPWDAEFTTFSSRIIDYIRFMENVVPQQ